MHPKTDYILGIDYCMIQNVTVRNERHNTDHYLVMGCLHGAVPSGHSHYLGKRKSFPLKPPKTPGGVNRLLTELQGDTPKPPQQERLPQAWI